MKVTFDTSCDVQQVRKVRRDMYIENKKRQIRNIQITKKYNKKRKPKQEKSRVYKGIRRISF